MIVSSLEVTSVVDAQCWIGPSPSMSIPLKGGVMTSTRKPCVFRCVLFVDLWSGSSLRASKVNEHRWCKGQRTSFNLRPTIFKGQWTPLVQASVHGRCLHMSTGHVRCLHHRSSRLFCKRQTSAASRSARPQGFNRWHTSKGCFCLLNCQQVLVYLEIFKIHTQKYYTLTEIFAMHDCSSLMMIIVNTWWIDEDWMITHTKLFNDSLHRLNRRGEFYIKSPFIWDLWSLTNFV